MSCNNKVVILSIGHDKKRQGAVSDGMTEYVLAKRWAHLIKEYTLYRTVVVDATLTDTVRRVNQLTKQYGKENCIAIELHFNACGNPYVVGSEVLYFPFSKTGKLLAESFSKILFQYRPEILVKDRGAKPGWYQGIKNGKLLYFLKKTACPAIIIEPMFLNHAVNLSIDDQDRVCLAIGKTINKILN